MDIKDYMNTPKIRELCEEHMSFQWLRKYNSEDSDQARIVEPQGNPPGIIGIGFDYALRFLIAREGIDRVNWPVAHQWFADDIYAHALGNINKPGYDQHGIQLFGRVLEKAHDLFDRYSSQEESSLEKIATCAQYLAYLEGRYGDSGDNLSSNFKHSININEELIKLLSLAPVNDILGEIEGEILLNPRFKIPDHISTSFNSDADLIIGRTLIDVKVTKNHKLERSQIRVLVGMAAVASEFGTDMVENETGITTVGLYHARHGALSILNLEDFVHDFSKFSKALKSEMEAGFEEEKLLAPINKPNMP